LNEKLKIFPDELIARQQTADAYNRELKDVVEIPHVMDGATSAWAQYTVCLPNDINREKLMTDLKEVGIPTMIYYVKPLHLQTAYKHNPTAGALSVCEALANKVLSLPMSGYVDNDDVKYIIDQSLTLFGNKR
jgi:dTDP-4-amino-4,6-dideoxygalactose transaminase